MLRATHNLYREPVVQQYASTIRNRQDALHAYSQPPRRWARKTRQKFTWASNVNNIEKEVLEWAGVSCRGFGLQGCDCASWTASIADFGCLQFCFLIHVFLIMKFIVYNICKRHRKQEVKPYFKNYFDPERKDLKIDNNDSHILGDFIKTHWISKSWIPSKILFSGIRNVVEEMCLVPPQKFNLYLVDGDSHMHP